MSDDAHQELPLVPPPPLHRVDQENAAKIWEWITTRGGLALWQSIDLSRPDLSWTCPLRDSEGKEAQKPDWRSDSKPYRVITDPKEVLVETMKEVRRFHVGVKRGGGFMSFVLTDASSTRVRAACEKAGPNATYVFDYGAQDAIILVPDKEIGLQEWAQTAGLAPKEATMETEAPSGEEKA